VRLLCAADIHLGRRPSRLPVPLAERARDLGPAGAWRRMVDEALDLAVDAVLLAGDVVDSDDDFFEAYADLREGVERLRQAQIPVFAVAGNHDVQVLPRLAEAVPEGFTLLGQGGRWEARTVPHDDGARVRILGWSFPESHPTLDPLASLAHDRASGVTIGLLHCDRDQTGSTYAPVRSADLAAAPVDAWLLGHVHKPDIAPGPRPMGYLGSLVGTDPGEPGAHGAWLLEVAPDGRIDISLLPLAPLRWETLELRLDDLADAGDVLPGIASALDTLPARLDGARPEAIGCRLRLAGRTPHRRAIGELLSKDEPRGIHVVLEGGVRAFVHAWTLEAQPAYDLAALAGGSDPVGLLARKLLTIRGQGDPDERRTLLRSARERLVGVVGERYLKTAHLEAPDTEAVAHLLESAALEALDALLAQAEERS